jgi:hypothetical protein
VDANKTIISSSRNQRKSIQKYIQIFENFLEYFTINQVQLDNIVAWFKYHVYLDFAGQCPHYMVQHHKCVLPSSIEFFVRIHGDAHRKITTIERK